MSIFAAKLKELREKAGMSQTQLASAAGVSDRTISSYETGKAYPRGRIIYRLASALGVSPDYLRRDDISDPAFGMERVSQVEPVRQRFGAVAAQELEELLERNLALFAGGEVPQEDKDAFFAAVTKAYWVAKEAAQLKYSSPERRSPRGG